jgi:hypothetical protein
MPELLTNASISYRIEQLISDAKEFVYLVSPYLYYVPQQILNELSAAHARGVRIVLIYKKGLVVQGKQIERFQSLPNIEIFCSERLHAKAYLNEREAIVSSFNLMSGEASGSIDFAVQIFRADHPDIFDRIRAESEGIRDLSLRMRIDQSKLVEVPVERAKPEKKAPKPLAAVSIESKKLTSREKQNLILELFAKECQDCSVKVEDHERLRVQGSGVVIFTSKERVEVIFVRYAAFNLQKDNVKEYILSEHPGLQVWTSYNRMTFNVDKSHEVVGLFSTVKEALVFFKLV